MQTSVERTGTSHKRKAPDTGGAPVAVEHYLRLVWYRKWIILATFLVTTIVTFIVVSRLPDVFTSETLILVDPQKVPEAYVKSTVTGDVRNRLGTLSQQILSATRLQKIIDTLGLYPNERKNMAREEVILRMRRDIGVQVVSDFGAAEDLQAFRISYSGNEPKLVAQVANELASLFIEENLKAREQQATGTSDFLANQLQETRKTLADLEGKLKDFKLRHIGEMPEQQASTLQIFGQMQSQLQLESEALNRAEQQKAYLQSLLSTQTVAPVVDLDALEQSASRAPAPPAPAPSKGLRAQLDRLRERYSDDHPDVKRVKAQIRMEEAKAESAPAPAVVATAAEVPRTEPLVVRRPQPAAAPAKTSNPVIESQLRSIESEIAKRKEEQQRLLRVVRQYQAKLEAVPVREQQISDLVRDYEISKGHYKQLLEKQLAAQTATQLEIRQKGEKFTVLDAAQPAEKPSKPNRGLLNAAGSLTGLVLGILLALATEFMGMCITAPEQLALAAGVPVLEVIPVIHTQADQVARRRRLFAVAAGLVIVAIGSGGALLYHFRDRLF